MSHVQPLHPQRSGGLHPHPGGGSPAAPGRTAAPRGRAAPSAASPSVSAPSGDGQDSLTGLLRRLLDQLNLSSLDSGDLLLLALLFFLFREGADDELLAALGLLLIL